MHLDEHWQHRLQCHCRTVRCRRRPYGCRIRHPSILAVRACEDGQRWHYEDKCCVRTAQPCGDGFEWRQDEVGSMRTGSRPCMTCASCNMAIECAILFGGMHTKVLQLMLVPVLVAKLFQSISLCASSRSPAAASPSL